MKKRTQREMPDKRPAEVKRGRGGKRGLENQGRALDAVKSRNASTWLQGGRIPEEIQNNGLKKKRGQLYKLKRGGESVEARKETPKMA